MYGKNPVLFSRLSARNTPQEGEKKGDSELGNIAVLFLDQSARSSKKN
jgi:hypothetical protein